MLLFPSFRDKQESLEFLPWLVVYKVNFSLSWVTKVEGGSIYVVTSGFKIICSVGDTGLNED